MTRELALASGLAELMERLQSRNGMKFWYSTKDYPERAFVHEYVSDATIDESIKCDFDEFGNSELWRYRIDYLDAKSSSIISVPNRLVNLICGSNGLCAGNSKAEAIVQGASEVFERYVQKIIARDHIKCPYIRKESLSQYSFVEKMQCFEELGLKWELMDCTNEGRFPVVGLLVVDRKNMRYAVVLGANVDFEIAVERCVTELLQGRNIQNLAKTHMKPIDFEKFGNQTINWDVEQQSDYYDFIDNYISNNGQHPVHLLLETEWVNVPSIFRHLTNNEEAFQYILDILDANQLSLYFADFSYLGFPTYRVYIPKLSRIFEMNQESFEFSDHMKDNMGLMMKINDLNNDEKQQLVGNLVKYSSTYINRRNAFQSILFRFCGEKDFDFNFTPKRNRIPYILDIF